MRWQRQQCKRNPLSLYTDQAASCHADGMNYAPPRQGGHATAAAPIVDSIRPNASGRGMFKMIEFEPVLVGAERP
jgi:hypothetical protein